MSSRQSWVLSLITGIVGDKLTAELVIETLEREGLLNLGYGDKDVEAILSAFKAVFGTTKVRDTDRYAASRLAAKYSPQAVVGIINLLAHSDAPYKPVVGSVTQLEDKWVNVLAYVRKQQDNDIIEV